MLAVVPLASAAAAPYAVSDFLEQRVARTTAVGLEGSDHGGVLGSFRVGAALPIRGQSEDLEFEQRAWVGPAEWLARSHSGDESELARITEVIDEADGRSWAIAEAQREVELAVRTVDSVPLDEPARAELIALTSYLPLPDAQEDDGTGFPRDFYLASHLYRLVFPLSALGRYLRQVDQ